MPPQTTDSESIPLPADPRRGDSKNPTRFYRLCRCSGDSVCQTRYKVGHLKHLVLLPQNYLPWPPSSIVSSTASIQAEKPKRDDIWAGLQWEDYASLPP